MTELMNTKEVAAYLGIHEKKVYYLAKAGRIPCTRVTGKWIFPKALIDQWIEDSAKGPGGGRKEDERPAAQASGSSTGSKARVPVFTSTNNLGGRGLNPNGSTATRRPLPPTSRSG